MNLKNNYGDEFLFEFNLCQAKAIETIMIVMKEKVVCLSINFAITKIPAITPSILAIS